MKKRIFQIGHDLILSYLLFQQKTKTVQFAISEHNINQTAHVYHLNMTISN